jgi:serine/threonine-protein kinase RsbT
MNDHCSCVELAHLPIVKMQDVLLARFLGRDLAAKLGFAPAALTRIATAISEITRNVVQHAGAAGEIQISQLTQADQSGLRITVTDSGKGMEHSEHLLEECGLSAIGAGLPGARRLADQFQINTAAGAGTTVTMDFWIAPAKG